METHVERRHFFAPFLDRFGYFVLRSFAPGKPSSGHVVGCEKKLPEYFGDSIYSEIAGKTVIDFGCGVGDQTIELASAGADHVFAVDIQKQLLEIGKARAEESNLSEVCSFHESAENLLADVILSKDAFEHYAEPALMLDLMAKLLNPGGCIYIAFGPTWFHPKGGHLFSNFPWSHLLFTEEALIRWRSDFKDDGATKFSEVDGGLNQINIAQFEKILDASALEAEYIHTIPIKGLNILKAKALREFGSSMVVCKLVAA